MPSTTDSLVFVNGAPEGALVSVANPDILFEDAAPAATTVDLTPALPQQDSGHSWAVARERSRSPPSPLWGLSKEGSQAPSEKFKAHSC